MFAAVGVEGEHRPQQRLIIRDRHAGTLDTDRRARPAADVSSVRTYPAMATAVFVPAPRVPAAQPRGVSHAALMRETRSIDRASLVIGAGASVARSAPPTRAELARSNIVSAKLGGHWTPSLRRGALRPGSAWRRLGEIPDKPRESNSARPGGHCGGHCVYTRQEPVVCDDSHDSVRQLRQGLVGPAET